MSEATEKKRVYGIDLGTTYSAIAFINDDGKPEIIPNSDNERITPSVVFFEEPSEEGQVGNVIVGKIAKESAKTDPTRVVSFVKQEMGTGWTKEIDGITLNPEKVSAYILKRLAVDAKGNGDHDVKDVIITCPAYFGVLIAEVNAPDSVRLPPRRRMAVRSERKTERENLPLPRGRRRVYFRKPCPKRVSFVERHRQSARVCAGCA